MKDDSVVLLDETPRFVVEYEFIWLISLCLSSMSQALMIAITSARVRQTKSLVFLITATFISHERGSALRSFLLIYDLDKQIPEMFMSVVRAVNLCS
mgnify:CR=1 FL=1